MDRNAEAAQDSQDQHAQNAGGKADIIQAEPVMEAGKMLGQGHDNKACEHAGKHAQAKPPKKRKPQIKGYLAHQRAECCAKHKMQRKFGKRPLCKLRIHIHAKHNGDGVEQVFSEKGKAEQRKHRGNDGAAWGDLVYLQKNNADNGHHSGIEETGADIAQADIIRQQICR